MFDLQDVAVQSYTSDEYTTFQCQQCCCACSDNSAVMFSYDCIDVDRCNKHFETFHREMKHFYSVVIIAILVKSASVNLCSFMDSIKQLAGNLPDDVIANGIIINVCVISILFLMKTFIRFKEQITSTMLHIITSDAYRVLAFWLLWTLSATKLRQYSY